MCLCHWNRFGFSLLSSFSWLLCPLGISWWLWRFWCWAVPYFLALPNAPSSSYIIPALIVEAAISPGGPCSFLIENIRNQNLGAGVHTRLKPPGSVLVSCRAEALLSHCTSGSPVRSGFFTSSDSVSSRTPHESHAGERTPPLRYLWSWSKMLDSHNQNDHISTAMGS